MSERQDGDSHGRAHAITVLTPVKPLGTLRLRIGFVLTRVFPKLVGIAPLGSVYYTRWSILQRPPYNGPPQPGSRPRRAYLAWETTWSGVVEPYIEAFVHAVGPQIERTWGSSYGFPGARQVTALREYIQRLSLTGSYFWSAYPQASVRMVCAALEVAKEHEFLVEAARRSTPEEFDVVYRGFLERRQADL